MGFHGKFHGNYWDFNGVWWDLIGLLWTCVRFYCGWSSNQTRNIDGQPCQVGNYYQHLRILGAISRTHNLFTNTIKPWVWRHISLNTQCPCIILSSERGGNWKNLLTQSLTVVSFHKKERPHWLFQPVPATLEINILTWLSGLFFAMKNLAFSCQQNKKNLARPRQVGNPLQLIQHQSPMATAETSRDSTTSSSWWFTGTHRIWVHHFKLDMHKFLDLPNKSWPLVNLWHTTKL